MRPLPRRSPGRWLVAAFACAVALTGCERDPIDPPIRNILLRAPQPVLRPGNTMALDAQTFGADGQPVEVTMVWQSLTPQLASVDATGLVLGKAPGIATIRVSVGSLAADLDIELRNPPAASLALAVDSIELFLPDGAATLGVSVADSDGVAIVGAPLLWQSSAARLVTVTQGGAVTAKAAGVAYVAVEHEGRRDSVIVAVSAVESPTAPSISSVTPSTIVPGQPVVIVGTGFGLTAASNTVMVDGLAMTIDSVMRSRIVARLPVGAPCLPTSPVVLQLSTSGGTGVEPIVLQTAPQRSLGVGEAFVLTNPASAACNEIALDGGEYLVTLSHTARALGAGTVTLRMAGRVAAGATSSAAVAGAFAGDAQALTGATGPGQTRAADPRRQRAWRAHQAVLEGARDAVQNARAPALPRADLQVPPVNGIASVRIANIDHANFCNEFSAIGARTIFSGPHIAILEDTATVLGDQPLLTGQLDSEIASLGAEIESVMWPIAASFGDPLVMDDRLDDNGQIVIVLTPRMNAMRGGDLIAATLTCDFFPRSTFASSNVGELLYLQVPTNGDPGFAQGSFARWRFDIRSAIVHELKHVTSYAERLVRGQPLEEVWLEEATARLAEELYARQLYGIAQESDGGFEETVRCEIREFGAPAGCGDEPRMMRNHLDGLWDFLDGPAAHSPLGATAPGDVSFYGSAWALTRWAIDQSASAEATMLSGFALSGQTGVANLEGRVGLPWELIVPLWSLAMFTDGGIDSVGSGQIAFPSWNLTDLFGGLCNTLGPCLSGSPTNARYGRAFPARPILRPVGEFALTTAPIQPGGFIALRLTGTVSTDRQLLDLRGAAGALPSTVRLAILRVN
jgi:hypothetical protein